MPYPFQRVAVGRADETYHPDTLRAALAEFISAIIFVFAGEGSVIAFGNNDLVPLRCSFVAFFLPAY
jgi:hypothetical protein